MKKLEEITADDILQEFIKLNQEYSPADRSTELESMEVFRTNLLKSIKNSQPLVSVSLNKNYYRGIRTIALLKAMGVDNIPKSIKEVANLFSEMYPDEKKVSYFQELRNVIKSTLVDRDIRDESGLKETVETLIKNLKQHGLI